MSKTAILVENVSKAYQIGQIGSGTLSRDVDRFWQTRILGKEDPFLKIGESNDRSTKGESDIVWSLKDINFEVNQGDSLGIIGKNGAGKSTLLKLLSRVTGPTTGEIKVKGRIASLLEVGTGFHPELSGRENIYLNGAILGMRKKEITRKLDEIIAFSGVERYIDTPVKRYSSGMYVRLAFAVAAHLESEILIVDEVLAVGDAEFQKKCLGKMGEISKGEGRTVLFVSHNMAAVKSLCNKGIVLKNGLTIFSGGIDDSVSNYLNENKNNETLSFVNTSQSKINGIESVKILTSQNFINHEDNIIVEIKFYNEINNCNVGVAILNSTKVKVFTTVNTINLSTNKLYCEIPGNLLLKGTYTLDVATFKDEQVFEYINDVCFFQIVDLINDYKIYGNTIGDVKINCKWYLNL
ncbi:MAG: ABC transporter ATP-binding protein [Flavobacterium sp.]|nr:ABC transporter ATP-binding protein [Flavobacterium sp.]